MLRFFVILFLSFTSSLHSQDTHIDNHVEDILCRVFEDALKKWEFLRILKLMAL